MFGTFSGIPEGKLTTQIILWVFLSFLAWLILRKRIFTQKLFLKLLLIYFPVPAITYANAKMRNFAVANQYELDIVVAIQLILVFAMIVTILHCSWKKALIIDFGMFIAANMASPVLILLVHIIIPLNLLMMLP